MFYTYPAGTQCCRQPLFIRKFIFYLKGGQFEFQAKALIWPGAFTILGFIWDTGGAIVGIIGLKLKISFVKAKLVCVF